MNQLGCARLLIFRALLTSSVRSNFLGHDDFCTSTKVGRGDGRLGPFAGIRDPTKRPLNVEISGVRQRVRRNEA